MNASEYLDRINQQVQSIFGNRPSEIRASIELGFEISNLIQTWKENVPSGPYNALLDNSIETLEISLLSLCYGVYRSAFSSLRLSLEMLFGAVYYSTNLLSYIEWTKGSSDLNWSVINDEQNGVLSHRFYRAFFPELKEETQEKFTSSKVLYRDLSQHVHGNYSTWREEKVLNYNTSIVKEYHQYLLQFKEFVNFTIALRYLKELKSSQLEAIEPIINQDLNFIEPIRSYLGGPKDC